MEAVKETRGKSDPELRLLTDWSAQSSLTRRSEAAMGSIAAHVGVVLLLALLPQGVFESHRPPLIAHEITPLVAPPIKMHLPNPGKGKISKTVSMENLLPQPVSPPPKPAISTTRPAAPAPGKPFTPPQPLPAPAQPTQLPEPPKIEVATNQNPPSKDPIGQPQAPPPQIQSEEKPKLAFETPGAPPTQPKGFGKLAVPGSSVTEAIRGMSHGESGGVTVGDSGMGPGGLGPGMNRTPAAGRLETNAKVLSDTQGVDFAPYMLKVLTAVKRNWYAVYPESARLGTRGKVALVMTIDRSGAVPSLKISVESGVRALDLAAVAGVSAATPFPPLPSEFHGSQVRLQLVFAYNLPIN